MLRGLSFVSAFLLTLIAAPAMAQDAAGAEDGLDVAAMEQVLEALEADPDFSGYYAQCPADLFRTAEPIWRWVLPDNSMDRSVCERAPMNCFERCTQSRSGGACFGLARAVQAYDDDAGGSIHQGLYARACALGYEAGCTNRAAGMRNGGYDDEPFSRVEMSAGEACQFRSFEIACTQGDAWGCAMQGQSHHYGEGTPADEAAAVRHYERSCDISPDFAACDFARRALADIRAGVAN